MKKKINKKRKICFISGSRADYGILSGLIELASNDKDLKVDVVVMGQHVSKKHGNTYKEIIGDKINNIKKIKTLNSLNTPIGINKSVANGITLITNSLDKLRPDIIILLGDRFEIFSVAIACIALNIPIAHLHGGEVSEGSFDNVIRHSITKISHLHFASTAEHRKRIIQMGEIPKNVFNVGSLSLDNINSKKLFSLNELKNFFWNKVTEDYFMIVYHAVTLEPNTASKSIKNILKSLDSQKNKNFIFSGSNSDPEGDKINDIVKTYVKKNKSNSIFIDSMGYKLFLSLLKYSNGIIGNSSSAIIEAPYFRVASVNIGNRQNGRQKGDSIIDCGNSIREIKLAINKATSKNFKNKLNIVKNPYQLKNSNRRVLNILKNKSLEHITKKSFNDISASSIK